VSHLGDDDLVLHYYGEADAATAAHLEACPDCGERFERIRATLGRIADEVPEPGPDYESRLWERLRPSLPLSPPSRRWPGRSLVLPTALAASLLGAFLLGRQTRPPDETPPVRERILLVAVGDHLERSEVLLLELLNAEGQADTGEAAEDLLAENRLYRQAALRAGDTGVASVLDELERVLVEAASAPEPGNGLDDLRRLIESRGLVLKVHRVGSRLRDEGRTRPGPEARGES
jgi:hypothetical protein